VLPQLLLLLQRGLMNFFHPWLRNKYFQHTFLTIFSSRHPPQQPQAFQDDFDFSK
jgi:hypothetical protein